MCGFQHLQPAACMSVQESDAQIHVCSSVQVESAAASCMHAIAGEAAVDTADGPPGQGL